MANKKYADLESLQAISDNIKTKFATKSTVDTLSSAVAYINSSDNETITDVTIPSGVSAGGSIDVTAEVGQTIVVKEVDGNGKPTKWESAEYQPRTHWSEVGVGDLVPHTTFAPVYNDNFQMLVYPLPSFNFEAGKTYTVVYDGVEYTGTATAGTFSGMDIVTIGNTYLTTGVPSNEPFIVAKIQEVNMLAVVCLTEEEHHTIQIIGEKTVYRKIPNEYLEYRVVITPTINYDGYDVNVNWDELRSAIRAGMTVTGRYVAVMDNGEYRVESYRLAKAEINIDPTSTGNNSTDHLYFVLGLRNGNLLTFSYGDDVTIEVTRYADGTTETRVTSN